MAKQVIDIGSSPNDGQGDPLDVAFDKCNDNFTELYSFSSDTALQADGSVDGTNQLFTGHVGIGSGASIKTNEILHLKETITDDGAAKNAQLFEPELSGTTSIGGTLAAFRLNALYTATPSLLDFGILSGAIIQASSSSASDLLGLSGLTVEPKAQGFGATVANMQGIVVKATTSSTVTTSIGITVEDVGSISNTVNATGIRIDKQDATNAYGILLNGDDLGADIAFGAGQDVRMHYDGTNMTLEGSGITAVASTATVNNTIPIDINGTVYHIMLSTTA